MKGEKTKLAYQFGKRRFAGRCGFTWADSISAATTRIPLSFGRVSSRCDSTSRSEHRIALPALPGVSSVASSPKTAHSGARNPDCLIMKTRRFSAVPVVAWFFSAVVLATVLRGDDTDLARLRAKAEKGNVIAQYNLGLAYAEGKTVPKDPVEAYVWLRLAADNGGTGTALGALVHDMSGDQLDAARQRLEERRRALAAVVSGARTAPAAGSAAAAPPAPTEDRFVAMHEELAVLRVDKARLSQQLAAMQSGANNSNVTDAQAVQTKDVGLAAQLEAARKDLASALKANEELTARGKALVDEQDALKRQLAGDAATAKRLAEVEGQLEEARKGLLAAKDGGAEIERLKQDLALFRARNAALAEANQNLERDSRRDADAQHQGADAQAMLEELRRTNAGLQTQVTALTARLAQPAPATQGGGTSNEDLARLKDELKRANATVEMTVRSFALLREENERLKAKLAQTADSAPAAPTAQPKAP
jgi:hypothetical protein